MEITVVPAPSGGFIVFYTLAKKHHPVWYIERYRATGTLSRSRVRQSNSKALPTGSLFKFRMIRPYGDLAKFGLNVIEQIAKEDLVEMWIEHPPCPETAGGESKETVPPAV